MSRHHFSVQLDDQTDDEEGSDHDKDGMTDSNGPATAGGTDSGNLILIPFSSIL